MYRIQRGKRVQKDKLSHYNSISAGKSDKSEMTAVRSITCARSIDRIRNRIIEILFIFG